METKDRKSEFGSACVMIRTNCVESLKIGPFPVSSILICSMNSSHLANKPLHAADNVCGWDIVWKNGKCEILITISLQLRTLSADKPEARGVFLFHSGPPLSHVDGKFCRLFTLSRAPFAIRLFDVTTTGLYKRVRFSFADFVSLLLIAW